VASSVQAHLLNRVQNYVGSVPELSNPAGTLPRLVLLGGAVFCASRLVTQFVLDPTLWRHKRFGPLAFALSALWWMGETWAFLWPLLG
jgi:hypothetical protein